MSTPLLRPARESDLPRIAALGLSVNLDHHVHWPQLFRDATAESDMHAYWLRCLRADGALCLVAELDGEFAGMLIGQIVNDPRGPLLEPRRLFRVSTLAVEEGFRRRGIGLTLMREGMRMASLAKVQEVRLNVWEFNRAALALYERLGLVSRLRTMALELEQGASE